jgi:cysteine-rich repeat protein
LLDTRATATFESKIFGGVVTECDVIAKTVEGGVEKGYARQSGGLYLPDDNGPAISEATLRAKANPAGSAQTITYTAVPPGSGTRMGIDRDEDTLLNGVETNTGTFVDANNTGTDPALADTDGDGFDDDVEVSSGTDPTDPLSFPGGPVCGDSIVEGAEQCDDGNSTDGDCCSAACAFEPSGSFCADGEACNGSETCDGAGACLAGAPLDCDDLDECTADSCDGITGCGHDPIPFCGTAVPTTSRWGQVLLALMLLTAFGLVLDQRRKLRA